MMMIFASVNGVPPSTGQTDIGQAVCWEWNQRQERFWARFIILELYLSRQTAPIGSVESTCCLFHQQISSLPTMAPWGWDPKHHICCSAARFSPEPALALSWSAASPPV
jgi:hypothetical protein